MPRSALAARAEREIVRSCHRGLDDTDLRRLVVPALRRALSSDAIFVATADPETLLFTGAWPDEPLGAVTEQFLDNEFGRADVNKFAALATSSSPVASLDAVTHGDRMASPRYRDIMRPLGLGDELRAALVDDGRCWGYVCLHREDHRLGFGAAEAATLARLAPHLAHAMRVATARTAAVDAGTRPGVVVLDESYDVVATTPEAEQALALVEHDGVRQLPTPVYAVAAALTARPDRPPSVRVRTRTGAWLRLHASRLDGSTGARGIAVLVEPVEPRARVPLALAAYGLSRREVDVATLVLRGTATRGIADELHISVHTVQDHLKAVFDKVGVHSRRDLVGHLLNPGGPGSPAGSSSRASG